MKRAGGAGVQPHQFILARDVAAAVDDIGPGTDSRSAR
jgi:hypothetical protein